MKSKFTQIMSGFALITVLVLAVTAVSQAVASGKNTYNNIDDLRRAGSSAVGSYVGEIGKTTGNINLEGNKYSPYLYCIQKGKALIKATYTVKHYIEITGKTAYIDGITNKGYVSEENLTLAYILGGGNDDTYGRGFGTADPGTMRQNALWAFWNEWATTAHINFGLENYSWGAQQAINDTKNATEIGMNNDCANRNALNDEAENKENRQGLVASIQILNSPSNTVSSVATVDKEGKVNGEFIGPIKLGFEGELSIENGTGLEFYNKDRRKLNSISDIKSEEEFYIKNTSKTNIIKNLKFKVTAKGVLKVRIWILENESKNAPGQRLIVADSERKTNEKDLSINVTRKEEGNIIIHKQDKSTKENLQGAEFKIAIKKPNKTTKGWLAIDEKTGEYTYTHNFQNGKEFTTDEKGIVRIENIAMLTKDKDGTMYTEVGIYETKAPEGYDLAKQEGYEEITQDNGSQIKRVYCNKQTYKIKPNTTKDVQIDIYNIKTGTLEIIKQDTTEEKIEKLSGAKFKISSNTQGDKSKNTWLKQNNDGTYSYTSSYNTATEFITNKEGSAKLENLNPGIYYIYETEAPTGYDITVQEKYDSKNGWVNCGSKYVPVGGEVKVTLENDKLISLEGYVWIEKPGSKANDYNDKLDNGEEIITDKVTITLRNKSNNEVVASNPKTVTETYNGGEVLCYKFEKIEYEKLKDYYVHFDYSQNYEGYITVASDFEKAEGSKALVDSVAYRDFDLKTKDEYRIATTYKGNENEKDYGLSGLVNTFYDEKTYTLKNINLGIKMIHDPDYAISNTPAYIDVSIKGYNHRYYVGEKGTEVKSAPGVKIQSETDPESYTRAIYPSDSVYIDEDRTKELKVYVTYRIDITNNEMTNIERLYQEKLLVVEGVEIEFDEDRYTLIDDNWELEENSKNKAVIKNDYRYSRFWEKGDGFLNDSSIDEKTGQAKNNKYAYIKLQIKDNKVKELLTLGENEKQREKTATKATVKAYHKYERTDSAWKFNVEKDKVNHQTEVKTKEDKAAFLDLELGQNRTISGKVFEDSKDTSRENEAVGNGKYDENENKVEGVKVELGNYENNEFKVTNLYQVEYNEQLKTYQAVVYDKDNNKITVNSVNEEEFREKIKAGDYQFKKAETMTASDGTYSFVGVVPGEYFIRFTYGDGTQIIHDQNGNEVKVSSDEYKSTIVTEDVKKAFDDYAGKLSSYDKEKETGTATWYIGLNDYNLAVDDLAKRKELSDGKYEVTAAILKKRKEETAKAITAQTPLISIPIEYTSETIGDENAEYPNEIDNMDFGIIETPKVKIDITKKITNIKLTLQNGQTLFEGNPATANVPYTTDLDRKTEGGSTYVKVELDSEYIYGGTLEIKYEIKVTNNSDLDYIEDESSSNYGYYYKYGIISRDAKEKKVAINQVYDYIDPKLSYVSTENEEKTVTLKNKLVELSKKDYSNLEGEEKAKYDAVIPLVKIQEQDTGLTYDEILEMTGWEKLNSTKSKERGAVSSDTITINAKKLLSSGEDDLEFINIAEVVKVTTEPVTPANVELPQATSTETTTIETIGITDEVKLTVTPSTGGDRSAIYFVVGAIELIVLLGGIVLIKKLVLD